MKLSNNIIYEDGDIIVCHKRAGIAVQNASARQKDMVSVLKQYLAPKKQQVYVVHRLDQPVEGIIVFAKHKKAAAGLTAQITQGTMKKIYLAACDYEKSDDALARNRAEKNCAAGYQLQQKVHLEDYLVKDSRNNRSRVGSRQEKDAKLAVLDFTVEKILPEKGILVARIDLKTGRYHQIRVQMSNKGLPLHGDTKYNPKGKMKSESQTERRTELPHGTGIDDELLSVNPCMAASIDDELLSMDPCTAASIDDELLSMDPCTAASIDDELLLMNPCTAASVDDELLSMDPCTAASIDDELLRMESSDLTGHGYQNTSHSHSLLECSAASGSTSASRTQLALCAVQLTFVHPSTGKMMNFEITPENEIFSENN